MNKIPRVTAGLVLGASAFYGAYEAINQPTHETYAVDQVRDCAKVLGQQAVSATELLKSCDRFSDQFTPTTVTGNADDNRSITYKVPKPVDLLDAKLPEAVVVDQNIVKQNTNTTAAEFVIAGFLGALVGLSVGRSKQLKKYESPKVAARKLPRLNPVDS